MPDANGAFALSAPRLDDLMYALLFSTAALTAWRPGDAQEFRVVIAEVQRCAYRLCAAVQGVIASPSSADQPWNAAAPRRRTR